MYRGLYIHIPFCSSKCDYCDFYSFVPSKTEQDSYYSAVLSSLEQWGKRIDGCFDTLYFGGGTPSFFGGERLAGIIKKARECFDFADDTEITVECNPSSSDLKLFELLSSAGVNRVSIGAQSAVEEERRLLGRCSDSEQVKNAVRLARLAGINNISLDLMLGIPDQTAESLDESLDFIIESGVLHVSAYMLKVEPGTPLAERRKSLNLPDEDEVCDLYHRAVTRLEKAGLFQYEISNFAAKGFESRHNLKYWNCEEYLGIGPAAHSFIGGRRFYYERNIHAFIGRNEPIDDGRGGDEEEYVMLRLRLKKGLVNGEYRERFKKDIPQIYRDRARELERLGLVTVTDEALRLTESGFLLSNSVIGLMLS